MGPSCASRPPRAWANIQVTLVLPWVPATARVRPAGVMQPRSCAYFQTGRPRAKAAAQSVSSRGTAEDRTTNSTSSAKGGRVEPTVTVKSRSSSASLKSEAARSLPLMRRPRSQRMRAAPLKPAPPMPTRWIRWGSSSWMVFTSPKVAIVAGQSTGQ